MADNNDEAGPPAPEDVATDSVDDIRKGCFGSLIVIFTIFAASAYFIILTYIIFS